MIIGNITQIDVGMKPNSILVAFTQLIALELTMKVDMTLSHLKMLESIVEVSKLD